MNRLFSILFIPSTLIASSLILVGCGPSKAELEKQAREQKAAIDAAVAAELAERQRQDQTRIELEAKARADAAAEAERKREIVARRISDLELAYVKWGNVRKLSRAEEVASVIAKLSSLNEYQKQDEVLRIKLRKFDWRSEDQTADAYYKLAKLGYSSEEGEVVDDAANSELLTLFSTGAAFDEGNLGQFMKRLFPKAKID
jgi:hypothetical protein